MIFDFYTKAMSIRRVKWEYFNPFLGKAEINVPRKF
jgi:hypothetical protein